MFVKIIEERVLSEDYIEKLKSENPYCAAYAIPKDMVQNVTTVIQTDLFRHFIDKPNTGKVGESHRMIIHTSPGGIEREDVFYGGVQVYIENDHGVTIDSIKF